MLATLLALCALLVACGGEDEAAETAREGGGGEAVRVALVTDIGGLDDKSFNFLANQGLKRAREELGVEGRVLISRSPQDYVPNLSSAAQQGYDLVIAVGFLMSESVATVAPRFPDVDFAIVDFPQSGLKGKPKNVRGLLFKEQEAGYLAGYLAGLSVEDGATVSSVGGQKIPPVDHYIAGYQAGAKAANPSVKTLNGYSQDFVDQAKCKEVALTQISRGSKVVFQVAGGCGLGALDAAKQRDVWGIGVDADQSNLGEHILTSALKKVDVAVFEAIESVQGGTFQGGADSVFDVKSGGVGLGKISATVPQDVADEVEDVERQIADGEIANIPDAVK